MKVEAREFGNNVPIKPIEEPELILPFEFQWDIGHLDQPEDSEYRMKIPARLYYGHHVRLHPEDEPELLKDGEKNIKALKSDIKSLIDKQQMVLDDIEVLEDD